MRTRINAGERRDGDAYVIAVIGAELVFLPPIESRVVHSLGQSLARAVGGVVPLEVSTLADGFDEWSRIVAVANGEVRVPWASRLRVQRLEVESECRCASCEMLRTRYPFGTSVIAVPLVIEDEVRDWLAEEPTTLCHRLRQWFDRVVRAIVGVSSCR